MQLSTAHSTIVTISNSGPRQTGEREWTVVRPCANHQVVATGFHRGQQAGADHLKIIDTGIYLGNLGGCMSLQTGIGVTMPMPSDLEKIGHLIEAETEPLCCLDHA